ncbi:MAG TPA: trypsin-like peptidase domain-containing protein [Iamia sp.]
MSIIDDFPLDWTDPSVQQLHALLAESYFMPDRVVTFLQQAGISAASVSWNGAMWDVWAEIMRVAAKQAKLRALIDVVTTTGDAAVTNRIHELIAATPVVSPPTPDPDWAAAAAAGGVERIIEAEPTFIDSAFLRRGAELAEAVVRLVVNTASAAYTGTGFRIGPRHLLTNHHVLVVPEPVTSVDVWVRFESGLDGAEVAPTILSGLVGSIRTGAPRDWGVIEVEDLPDFVPVVDLADVGHVEVDDRVYIIQHPQGLPKKIGMVHNVVRHADADVVQYLTDTQPGSSGAPVFDERWRIVALHHRWVRANGEYRNQGQRIDAVVGDMAAAGVSWA